MVKKRQQTLIERPDFGPNQVRTRTELKKDMVFTYVKKRQRRKIKIIRRPYRDADGDWVLKFSYVYQHSFEKGNVYIAYLSDLNIEAYENGRWNPSVHLLK